MQARSMSSDFILYTVKSMQGFKDHFRDRQIYNDKQVLLNANRS